MYVGMFLLVTKKANIFLGDTTVLMENIWF